MKRELQSAREAMQENFLAFLDGMPDETKTQACQLIVDGFAPLFEELKDRTRKTVLAAQIGEKGFRIERTTNFLGLRVGSLIDRDEAEKLIEQGIVFSVCRNK